MFRTIFINVDGVLNSEKFFLTKSLPIEPWTEDDLDPEAVQLMNRLCSILRPTAWVLTSSWRSFYSLKTVNRELRNLGFALSFAGKTPRLWDKTPGEEIVAWLTSQDEALNRGENSIRTEAFAIIDTIKDLGERLNPKLVTVSFTSGFTEEHIKKVLDVFGVKMPEPKAKHIVRFAAAQLEPDPFRINTFNIPDPEPEPDVD